jgi:phytoene/squalene synthetase
MKAKFDILSAKFSKTITNHYSTSFSLGIYFLNKKLRRPIYAIYGFVRLADEIVDSFYDYPKASLLTEFRDDCFKAIERGISVNPVLNSFQQAVNQYGIKPELISLFLNSMAMDLDDNVYTPDKYNEYILGSAEVVGLMCLCVFTNGDEASYERLKEPAMKLGSAFQKVNFLRDINSDYHDLNRSYFPQVDLTAFSDDNKRAIEADIRNDFNAALKGIQELPSTSRKGVYLAYVYYKQLFLKISHAPAEQVMTERIRVSNRQKFMLMFDSLIRYKLNTL